MEPRISILTPTRNRPDNVKRLIKTAQDTAEGPIEFVFYLDDDDPAKTEVLELVSDNVRFVVSDRCILSEMWNRCAKVAKSEILMQCGDDIIFRSSAWDTQVILEFEKVPDKILLVHGRDGLQDERVATHGFLHRNWVDSVGYFVPPYFASDYNDMWLTQVADSLKRRVYLPEVYTEHMHPLNGKATWDKTHRERLYRHRTQKVERIWKDTAPNRQEDIRKLRAAINGADSG